MATQFVKSERLRKLPPYLFAEIDKKKKAAIAAGRDVINLGVGDPDRPTPRVDHPQPPASRREPGVPSVRPRPGCARAAALDRGILQEAVRPRPRPRNRDPGLDRLEGGARPSPAGRAQPGRDQPGPRPLLSGLSLQQHVRRGRRLYHAAGARARVSPRPRRHPRRRLRAGPADVPQLPQQPDRRRRPIEPSSRRSSSWRGRTISWSRKTPPTTRCTSSSPPPASSRCPGPRTWPSSFTVCPRPST